MFRVGLRMISLPIMLRYGYSQKLSTGVIAASGTLGQIVLIALAFACLFMAVNPWVALLPAVKDPAQIITTNHLPASWCCWMVSVLADSMFLSLDPASASAA